MKKYRSLVSLLFILISHLTFGQNYPVQVTTVLTPPYSLYLSDYASPESNSLQVIIHLRELDRPEYRVKLRITIEGQGITIRTRPGYMPPALILQGGVPEMLSGADLSRYLNPDNLDFSGISRQEFMKKGAFPEGFYTFRIEVLDYVRNVVVSNPGIANAWMILNDPPLINFPSNHEKVVASDPQNVMFNWTPLHTGSPNAAFSTEYEFTLVELYPEGRNPNDAIRVANPIFVTTTPSTSLNYGVMEPMLIPGRKYAFRIKAFDTSKRDLFKNNGYSEVFVFQFGDACIPPLNIKSESLDPNRVKISWEPADIHTAFTIQYKKQGSSTWLEEKSYTNSIILPGLQGGTTYQYHISGVCGTLGGALSDLASVTTLLNKEDEFSCGAPVPAIEIKTAPLPEDLQVDDLIKTADFEVSITSVEKNPDGSYKGTGRAFLPWLNFATVRVKFSSIRVNEEYRVYDGIVTTVYSPNSRFVANLDLADELDNSKDAEDKKDNAAEEDKFEGIEIPYDGDIKDVTFNPATGEVIVTNEDGTTTVLPLEKKENSEEYEDTRITDSNGDKWVIDKDGKVTQEPSTTAPNAIASAEAIDFTVQFAPNADQTYGFDKKTDDKLGTYDVIKVREQDYTVFWKSVETGHQDFINAQAPGKDEFPSIVGFKTSTGPAASMPGASKDQKQVIIIGQGNKEDQLTAYVKVKEEGKEETEVEVGRINVATYDKVKKRLVIVPVNDAVAEDGNSLTAAVNAIYKQAVAEWEITVEEKFTIDQDKLTGLDAGESGMLSSFPDKCRDFNREFKRDRSIDRDAYYLFLIKGSQSSRSGFMPFKRKFGYIFTDNLGSLSLATTIAHELGHGAFRLRHTFSSEAFMAAERSTNNLMDYKGGTELKKYQWDYVHDPESMNGWLQDDDESAIALADHFPEPLTVYYSDDPFVITMKRKGLTSSIIIEIEYRGQNNTIGDPTLGFLDTKRTIEVLKTNLSVQSECYEINKDHLGYRIIANFEERKLLFGHMASEYVEDNQNYRKHEFILFPSISASLTLINPTTNFSDKVAINGIELQMNNSVNSILPSQLSDVVLASASAEIPANKVLYVNEDCHLLVTKENTRATFTLKHDGFVLHYTPPLEVNVNYSLVPNISWHSTVYNFSDQSMSHNVQENSYFLGIAKSQVINSLNMYFEVLMKNTLMGIKGYDPYKDDNISFSIDQLKRNLEEDSKKNIYEPCIETNLDIVELKDPVLSSTFYFSENQNYLTDEGNGVTLESGIPVSISFAFDGTLGKIMSFDQIKIKSITLAGRGGIVLLYKNKPQVLLENIVILPGGKVLVNDTKLVGDLAEIQNIEQKTVGLIKALLALAIYKNTGVMPAVNSTTISRNTLTGSAVEVLLESEMRKAILDQVKNNNKILLDLIGDRIPENQKQNLNLATIMGIKE